MKSLFSLTVLLSLAAFASAQALYSIDISPLTPLGGTFVADGAVAFIDDHTLVVAKCYSTCQVRTFELLDDGFWLIADATGVDKFHRFIRRNDGTLILGGVVNTAREVLFSSTRIDRIHVSFAELRALRV